VVGGVIFFLIFLVAFLTILSQMSNSRPFGMP